MSVCDWVFVCDWVGHAGEIRGQVVFMNTFASGLTQTASATAGAVVPAATSDATGSIQVVTSLDGSSALIYGGVVGTLVVCGCEGDDRDGLGRQRAGYLRSS